MANPLNFRGIIRNVSYDPRLRPRSLQAYALDEFDVNRAKTTGIVQFDADTSLGYARWTAPKRTRTDALPRTYSVYHLPRKAVIIPAIKDEGYQTNNDHINFITYAWMNLANIYIILAWYEDAEAHPTKALRITQQTLNNHFVWERLAELRTYQQTALHWNTMHFERDFTTVFKNAAASYEAIGRKTGAQLIPSKLHLAELEKYTANGAFNLEQFRAASLPKSYGAAQRELATEHIHEHLLQQGSKAYFSITNWLGGEYHLTADEVFVLENDEIVIQESKNTSTAKMPTLSGIQDGLFKLILFANMDELYLNNTRVSFRVRLKLTGALQGQLTFPATAAEINDFATRNALQPSHIARLKLLQEEATANPRLEIEVTSNA